MSENNVMENILSIELGQMVMDGDKPSNCIMILTKRNRYCFRLSESFSTEKQVAIFKQFITDVNTPVEQPTLEQQTIQSPDEGVVVEPHKEEKHDGANLLDVPPSAPTDCEITTHREYATQD